MKTWPALLAPLLLCACGARTELYAPPVPQHPADYCKGAEATSVYVVTGAADLYSFDPPSGAFTPIGAVSCGDPSGPFSMAVDYEGKAYVIYNDGALFEVSMADASCSATSYVPSPSYSGLFGMGFSTDPDGKSETLFLASNTIPGVLASLDTATFAVSVIGTFSVDIGEAELTGTGAGDLFGFGPVPGAGSAHLAQIDKTDASIVTDAMVPISFASSTGAEGWAFASWGGDFYFFTSTDGSTSNVAHLHPADGSFDPGYATLQGEIVGAGVSTCAPH